MACVAFGCTNRFSKKTPGITFHRFPVKEEEREAWVKAVRRKDWKASKYSRLCSEHFTDDSFYRMSPFRVYLKEKAVPTIFKDIPAYLQNECISTLPMNLYLKQSQHPAGGYEVWSLQDISVGMRFGPYQETFIDINKDEIKDFQWQVETIENENMILDGRNEGESSWLPYVNYAHHKEESNMIIFHTDLGVYYVTSRSIPANTQLLVYDQYNNIEEGKVSNLDEDLQHYITSIVCGRWYHLKQNVPPPPRFPFTGDVGVKVSLTEDSRPLEFFELFFDDELIYLITTETNRHARECLGNLINSRHKFWTDTTPEEIRVFLGLLILQGTVHKPNMQWYWSRNEMIETPFFQNTMKRDRFLLIMKYLHFKKSSAVDKTVYPNPKLQNIYDIYMYLVNKFQSCYVPECSIIVDESLQLFKGHLGEKQNVPKERACSEIKFHMLIESCSGYVWNCVIYTGPGTEYNSTYKDFRITTQIVMTLIEPLLGQGYCLTAGNFFISPELCELLISHKTDIYGAVQMHRKGMPPALKHINLAKNEVAAFQRGKVMCLVWRDKKYVCLLSTIHSASMNCGSKEIVKPQVIVDYSDTMEGVDRCDHSLSPYQSPRKRQKMYYKKIFQHLLDISLWNSFILFKKLGGNMDLLNFRLKVLEELFSKYSIPTSSSGFQVRGVPSMSSYLRLTGRHFLKFVPPTERKVSPQWRCVVCCQKRDSTGKKIRKETRYCCLDCKVGLCAIPCFEIYHTKEEF